MKGVFSSFVDKKTSLQIHCFQSNNCIFAQKGNDLRVLENNKRTVPYTFESHNAVSIIRK